MTTTSGKIRIVIAGGGFTGLSAAMYLDRTLARRTDIQVTLINHENFVLSTPMLHEMVAGDLYPGDMVNPIQRILRHVAVVEAEVWDVDLNARVVRCVGSVLRHEIEFPFEEATIQTDESIRRRPLTCVTAGGGFAGKLRVGAAWTLDLLFGRDIEQVVTVRDVEGVTQRLERLRAREALR